MPSRLDRQLILGIDPGTEWLGYCLIRLQGNRQPDHAEKVGAVHLKGRLHFRLAWLQEEMEKLLAACPAGEPLDCVVEKAIVWGGNLATIALAEARGVILACIGRRTGARLHEYHASQIKKGITGRGNCTKYELAAMVSRILGLEDGLPLDATDAAGLALYHALHRPAWGAPGSSADDDTTEVTTHAPPARPGAILKAPREG